MRLTSVFAALLLLATIVAAPAEEKRSWLGRLFHPFGSSEKIPEYNDPKIRGLVLTVELPSEPVKLSEVRQLPVHILLSNRGDKAVQLIFPTEQRIEILLHDSTGRVVTRWSDNRAFEERPSTLLINPSEHVEYSETIATRELTAGKVFTVEVVVPAYPELDAQRKSIAAP
jgi:Intracellular proteinase inhibitor